MAGAVVARRRAHRPGSVAGAAGPQVDRQALRVEAAAEVVRLTVEDTGIGIPPEHQERIFERFYRVDQSHSRATGGTGLGLSIVKHIAAYHKASIELASRPGEGTRITVTFPHAE